MVLISAKNINEASEKARSRNLNPTEWVFIPWDTEGRTQRRFSALAGMRVNSREDLVGYFSANERAKLLKGCENE